MPNAPTLQTNHRSTSSAHYTYVPSHISVVEFALRTDGEKRLGAAGEKRLGAAGFGRGVTWKPQVSPGLGVTWEPPVSAGFGATRKPQISGAARKPQIPGAVRKTQI